jgi:hypothetical protein
MSEPPAPAKQNPQRYEIAQPLSYDAFPLDPAQKPAADLPARGLTDRAHLEAWDDAEKDVPVVAEKDRANFIPPERRVLKSALADSVPREKRAVWIVHGMGQQIPFETVDGLARGLLQTLGQLNPPQTPTPRLRTVKIAGQVLQRVEIDVRGAAPDAQGHTKNYDLHLYETYWAPKTEGVAKLSDVVSFLWDGGTRGLLNSFKSFQRAMFGGMGSFKIPLRSPFYLCITLLVLAALTVINGVILASSAAKTGLPGLGSLDVRWQDLAALATCMIAVAFTFGCVLFLADLSKLQNLNRFLKLLFSTFGWFSLFITVAEILKTAFLMLVITHFDWINSASRRPAASAANPPNPTWLQSLSASVASFFTRLPFSDLQTFATVIILAAALVLALALIFRAFLRSSESPLRGDLLLLFFTFLAFVLNLFAIVEPIRMYFGKHFPIALPHYLSFIASSIWVWPFLIMFSAKVREIMVQYVGDVAIYVRPNKLDRFDQVRDEIKEAARSVVSAIFTAYKPPADNIPGSPFLYHQVALVGHSLGSVIAYDTLNRIMLDDWLSGNALQVSERANSMITFGSPLNKTAFFFTIQAKDSLHIRERLAATVQPLIMSYPKFRKLRWINVFSRNDIVSGSLKFYDLPGFTNPPNSVAVKNIPDPDAFVPLVAHVSYWNNSTVWQQLLQQIAP